jgi:hypothetical protein
VVVRSVRSEARGTIRFCRGLGDGGSRFALAGLRRRIRSREIGWFSWSWDWLACRREIHLIARSVTALSSRRSDSSFREERGECEARARAGFAEMNAF